jgi:hypothetical protein
MSRKWSSFDKWTIGVSIAAIVVGVVIAVFVPEVRVWLGLEKPRATVKNTPPSSFLVTGTVMDDKTKQAVSGAEITVVGRPESCRSEDNGNFRMQIYENSDAPEPIRLLVHKDGYQTLDRSVSVPSSQLILPLQKTRK